ncbi:UNKNOWN [Stylonychia lemnae]|uniref:UBA domain-containing protein n=1 Tax=Stylonychia lemnae TaxID=5949 RepID=A0A078AB34_STYLE|nr:UNKNOWN [Stylonychia lemnae]|eukprot:CDW79086.1 UNKNOWN [Stylonychia lemnae]
MPQITLKHKHGYHKKNSQVMPHYMENNLVNGFDTKKTITQKRVALLSNDPFDINCDTLIQVKDIDEQSGREGSRVFFREKTLSNNILIPNVVINNAQEIQSTSPRGIISATINIDRNFIVQNKFQGFSNTQKLISNESRENDQIYYLGPKSISAMKEKKISNKSVISDHKSSNFHNLGVLTNNQENKIEHSYTIKDQKSKYRISIMSYKNSNLAQNNKNFLTTEHNLKSQFKRYSVQTQKRGRKNSMYSQQRKSKRIKQVIQTKLAQNKNNHYVPFMSKDDYKSQLDETTKQKLLVIELFQMGFFDEAVERAIHYTGAKTIEDCLPFLILNEKNVMDHQFVSVNNAAYGSQYEEYKNIHPQSQHCFLCLKNRKKQTKKTLKQINERLLTRQTSRKSRRDSQNDAVPSDEELEQQICVFPNRVLVSNKKYMQIQEERGVILNTYEGGIVLTNQEMVPPMRLNLEDSKSFQNEDNVQDIEATRRNFLDQTNQDLTAFDINRLNKNIISNNINVLTNSNNQVTYLNGGGQESPKFKQIYQYFEPKKNLSPEVDNYMKEKQGIDIKLETEGNLNVILHKVNPHHRKSNKNIKDETINKVLFTNYQDQKSEFSRTKTDVNKKFNEGILKVNTFRSINPSVLNSNSLGINGGMSSSKKDSSKDNDVMYSFRSMTSRHATEDERCLVCQLPLDYHNPDFNQDLLSVQLRFNEQTIFKETENRIMSNQSFQSSLPNQNENENDNENENSIEGQEDFATLVDRGIRNRTQLAIPNQINLKTQSNYLSPMSIADQLENTNDLDKQKMRALKFRQEIVERRIRSQEQFIDSNRSLVSNPKCSICMDPKFFPQQSGENESVVLDQLQSLEGRNMIQLDQCNHIYCVQCFKDYLKYQINNGLVLDIKCCEQKIQSQHLLLRLAIVQTLDAQCHYNLSLLTFVYLVPTAILSFVYLQSSSGIKTYLRQVSVKSHYPISCFYMCSKLESKEESIYRYISCQIQADFHYLKCHTICIFSPDFSFDILSSCYDQKCYCNNLLTNNLIQYQPQYQGQISGLDRTFMNINGQQQQAAYQQQYQQNPYNSQQYQYQPLTQSSQTYQHQQMPYQYPGLNNNTPIQNITQHQPYQFNQQTNPQDQNISIQTLPPTPEQQLQNQRDLNKTYDNYRIKTFREQINKNYRRILSPEDQRTFEWTDKVYKMGFTAVLASIPINFYCSSKIASVPEHAKKYLMRSLFYTSFSSMVFALGLYRYQKFTKELSYRYLTDYSIQQLEDLDREVMVPNILAPSPLIGNYSQMMPNFNRNDQSNLKTRKDGANDDQSD